MQRAVHLILPVLKDLGHSLLQILVKTHLPDVLLDLRTWGTPASRFTAYQWHDMTLHLHFCKQSTSDNIAGMVAQKSCRNGSSGLLQK
jgi:hypothetical protein